MLTSSIGHLARRHIQNMSINVGFPIAEPHLMSASLAGMGKAKLGPWICNLVSAGTVPDLRLEGMLPLTKSGNWKDCRAHCQNAMTRAIMPSLRWLCSFVEMCHRVPTRNAKQRYRTRAMRYDPSTSRLARHFTIFQGRQFLHNE